MSRLILRENGILIYMHKDSSQVYANTNKTTHKMTPEQRFA